MDFTINPISGLKGSINVPGDKSISHRSLIFGALAKGITHVTNFLPSQDCVSTLQCLQQLGVAIDQISPSEIRVTGVGLHGFKEPTNVLDVGNSGTTIRIMPGILAGQNFFSVMTGDASIRRRPMKRIVEPLYKMGGTILGRDDGQYPPIAIRGNPLTSIEYKMPVASAQVKTALLLAGLLAEGTTVIEEPFKSRDHSERMLLSLGANLEVEKEKYTINGNNELNAVDIQVPGDVSSAAFFVVGALITKKSRLVLPRVGVNPTRSKILEILKEMGAKIHQVHSSAAAVEPAADIEIESSELSSFRITEDIVPLVIDELPILAVAATQSEGRTVIEGARELRIKESDRIAVICSELTKLGADIKEKPDGFVVNGPTKLRANKVDSYGDHRLAMALSIAALVAEGTTTVANADCVRVSFPDFLDVLRKAAA